LLEVSSDGTGGGRGAAAVGRDSAVVCSIALQYGAPADVIRTALLRDTQNIPARRLPPRSTRSLSRRARLCERANEGSDVMTTTFVATFLDGEVTRMSVFTSLKKLDMARGVRLARVAYESRMRQAAPPIVEARFERNGEIVEHYTREQLDAVP